MTPKEKAINLLEQFRDVQWIEENRETIKVKWLQGDEAKQCALIAVDEMIKMYNEMNVNGFLKPNSVGFILNDVKKEIENL
jgi:hypothetical protein